MNLLKRIWKSIVLFVVGDEPAFLQQHCCGDPAGAFAPEEEEDDPFGRAKRPSSEEGRQIVLNSLRAGRDIYEAATALAGMGGPRTWNGFLRRMRNLREKDWEEALRDAGKAEKQ